MNKKKEECILVEFELAMKLANLLQKEKIQSDISREFIDLVNKKKLAYIDRMNYIENLKKIKKIGHVNTDEYIV